MSFFSKSKDFIAPNEEMKEALGSSVKELLDGKLLADVVIRKNITFILFLTFLGIFYIANGYSAEKLHKERMVLEREVSELRFESITQAAKLMFMSKQSEVKKRVEKEGLRLQESKVPPIKIYE